MDKFDETSLNGLDNLGVSSRAANATESYGNATRNINDTFNSNNTPLGNDFKDVDNLLQPPAPNLEECSHPVPANEVAKPFTDFHFANPALAVVPGSNLDAQQSMLPDTAPVNSYCGTNELGAYDDTNFDVMNGFGATNLTSTNYLNGCNGDNAASTEGMIGFNSFNGTSTNNTSGFGSFEGASINTMTGSAQSMAPVSIP